MVDHSINDYVKFNNNQTILSCIKYSFGQMFLIKALDSNVTTYII